MTRILAAWRSLSSAVKVGAVALLVILALSYALYRAHVRTAKAAIGEANARAAADTTRAVTDRQLQAARALYGDSIAVVTRLVVQERQRSDGLDRELRQTRVAIANLTAAVRTLEARVASTGGVVEVPRPDSAGGGTVRSATFDVREAPYTVHAEVSLPPAPARGSLSVRVAVDPADIRLRLGCTARNANGVREGQATATGPDWLTLRLERVETDPDVCNADRAGGARGGLLAWLRGRSAIVAGPSYGVFFDIKNSTVRHGPGVSVTWKIVGFP